MKLQEKNRKVEMLQAKNENNNQIVFFEFKELLEAYNASESFLKSLNHSTNQMQSSFILFPMLE